MHRYRQTEYSILTWSEDYLSDTCCHRNSQHVGGYTRRCGRHDTGSTECHQMSLCKESLITNNPEALSFGDFVYNIVCLFEELI